MAETPRPPSELRPDVPPAIESIVLRLLEKDPARRFQNAEHLSAALAALDPPAPVGNAPTLAAGTNRTPGLRAPNAAAGATITDERPPHPAASATLGGIPKAIMPTPRDSMTARRPAQHGVKSSANRRGLGWPSAAVILFAASVALPLLTRSKPEAPLKTQAAEDPGGWQPTNAPGSAKLPVPEGAVVRRNAPYHPYAAASRPQASTGTPRPRARSSPRSETSRRHEKHLDTPLPYLHRYRPMPGIDRHRHHGFHHRPMRGIYHLHRLTRATCRLRRPSVATVRPRARPAERALRGADLGMSHR